VDAPDQDATGREPLPSSDPWSDPGAAGPPPAAPGVPGVPANQDVRQPPPIRLAVRLMWLGAIISAVSILVMFLLRDELREQVEEAEPSLTAEEVDTELAIGLTAVGLVGVISVALWIWMATANGQGRAWARTVATVLGLLNVLYTLLSFLGGQLTPLGVVLNLGMIALAVVILVLLYRPESNRFYDAVTRQRLSGYY
jgi:hypothetical protein